MIAYALDSKINVLFVDFWDTIVHRKVSDVDIKKKTCEFICHEYNIGLTPLDVFLLRQRLEGFLYKKKSEYTYSDLMEWMYSAINNNGQVILDDASTFKKKVYDYEVGLERKYIYLDEELFTWLQLQGKTNYIVSDFYLGKEVLKDFLTHLGADKLFTDVFVSCDEAARKESGELYKVVLKKTGIDKSKVCMIGDNKKSDVVNAKKCGMDAIYRPYKAHEHVKLVFDKENFKQEVLRICKSELPLVSYVYTFYIFIERLYDILIKNNIENAFFFAREGELLKEMFDIYQNSNSRKKIKTHYLCVSRKATLLPSFRTIRDEDFSKIKAKYDKLSGLDFFNILGITENMSDGFRKQWATDSVISDFDSFISTIKNDEEFCQVFEEKRVEQRNKIKRYISQFHVDINLEGLTVVDIGWKGSIQDNLSNIYDQSVAVNGYYFGITEPGEICRKSTKKGIIFEYIPLKTKDCEIWAYNPSLYERVLMASHGATLRYEENAEGVIAPVFDDNTIDKDNYSKFVNSQKEIANVFKQLTEYMDAHILKADDIYSLFLFARVYSLFYLSSNSQTMIRYLEKNLYDNVGVFDGFEKKTYLGYIKKLLNEVKYNRHSIDFVWYVEFLSYFFKVKGLMGLSAFFSRCYAKKLGMQIDYMESRKKL